jgi:hypothetical protein
MMGSSNVCDAEKTLKQDAHPYRLDTDGRPRGMHFCSHYGNIVRIHDGCYKCKLNSGK